MSSNPENWLFMMENRRLESYLIDDLPIWEVGRASRDNIPDLMFQSLTVSRRHGRFQNIDGVWFYIDYGAKNGTLYNGRRIERGIGGRIKPIVLQDQDLLLFGGERTVGALFSEKCLRECLRDDDFNRIIDEMGIRLYGE